MRSSLRVASLVASLALGAAACGTSSSTQTAAGSSSAEAAVPADDLATNDDVRLVEVLDVKSGSATTLTDAVTGDRPVLLWFWAPH